MLKEIFVSIMLFFVVCAGMAYASETTDVNLVPQSQVASQDGLDSSAVKEIVPEESLREEESGFLEYSDPKAVAPMNIKDTVMRAGGSLFFVVLILGVTLFLLKFVLNKKDKPFFKERMISVLERNYIEPKKTIMLVRTLDRLLVVGVAGDNINVLSEIKDPDVVNKAVSGDFYGYMQKYTTVEGKKD